MRGKIGMQFIINCNSSWCRYKSWQSQRFSIKSPNPRIGLVQQCHATLNDYWQLRCEYSVFKSTFEWNCFFEFKLDRERTRFCDGIDDFFGFARSNILRFDKFANHCELDWNSCCNNRCFRRRKRNCIRFGSGNSHPERQLNTTQFTSSVLIVASFVACVGQAATGRSSQQVISQENAPAGRHRLA